MGKSIEAQLSVILEDYSKSLEERVVKAGAKLARECANEIKQNSPKDRSEYYKGWSVKKGQGFGGSVSYTVYNKTHPGLTHLLEKGHETGKGRTKAQPHIKPAEEKYNQLFYEALEEAAEHA